jgi:hypothetical protein
MWITLWNSGIYDILGGISAGFYGIVSEDAKKEG